MTSGLGTGTPAGDSGSVDRGTVGTVAPIAPAQTVLLRWVMFAAMVTCGVVVAATGRWNGVALLQVVFLLAFFATYANFIAGVARLVGRRADH